MAGYDEYHYEELSQIFQKFGITEDYLYSMLDCLGDDARKLVKDLEARLSKGDIGNGYNVYSGVDDPLPGVGFVRLQGDKIVITNTKVFAGICMLCHDVDLFLEDGKPVIEFTIRDKEKE